MADNSLSPTHATVDQSTYDGLFRFLEGMDIEQEIDFLNEMNFSEAQAQLISIGEGTTNMDSDSAHRFMRACTYDRDFGNVKVQAGEREIVMIDMADEDKGRPYFERILQEVKQLYSKLASLTQEQPDLIKATWKALPADKKKDILRKSW